VQADAALKSTRPFIVHDRDVEPSDPASPRRYWAYDSSSKLTIKINAKSDLFDTSR